MQQISWAGLTIATAMTLLGACASNGNRSDVALAPGETLRITEDTWNSFLQYRRLISGQKTGAFVVAMVGGLGVGGVYVYCESGADRCRSQSAAGPVNQALGECRDNGSDCIVFAQNAEIVAKYEIVK